MDTENLIYPLGDSAMIVKLGDHVDMRTHQRVIQYAEALTTDPFPGMIEVVPAYTTVTIYYDPWVVCKGNIVLSPFKEVKRMMDTLLQNLKPSEHVSSTTIQIPVCYEGDLGPDLDFVAQHNGLSNEEVIRIHTAAKYPVYMIGFAPGFPYLGGMSNRIAAPRKLKPRASVPAGSVGIAGMQTGIYSIETPGGWQLIGRTPVQLFNIRSASQYSEESQSQNPSLLQAGDTVIFYSISRDEYDAWDVNRL